MSTWGAPFLTSDTLGVLQFCRQPFSRGNIYENEGVTVIKYSILSSDFQLTNPRWSIDSDGGVSELERRLKS